MEYNEELRLTVWEDPSVKFSTQWGRITYLEWLEAEGERMARNGWDTEVLFNDNHQCALFRNKTYENSRLGFLTGYRFGYRTLRFRMCDIEKFIERRKK